MIAVDVHAINHYRLDATIRHDNHAPVLVAYAIRDAYGWALMARCGKRGRVATVERVDIRNEPTARRATAGRLYARAAGWRPTSP